MRAWLVAVLGFAFGCGSPSVADDLTLTVDANGELNVDTACRPSCGGDDSVSGVISYESDTRPEGDTVDFKQYKVDYTLHGIADVPYFAGRSDLPLRPGASESFTLQVVGSAQRQFVRKAMKGKPVSGTAKLQFAGYDFDNKQVFIDTEFDISFDDIMNADANPDAGADDAP
jgi:hypothetical protein